MPLSAYWYLIRDNRNVRLSWMAQVVSELGDWFYQVTIFSFLLELTGSAQAVSFAFLMQVLPQVLSSPAAGVINDRVSRRKVMQVADWTRAVIVFLMMFVRSREMLPLLYLLLALETVCWAFFEPASRAIIPNIATPEQIPIANALGSATWSINFALGAAIGGVVGVVFGRETVFVLDSLSFIASALLIRRMRFDEPHAVGKPPLRWSDFFDYSEIGAGLRYVRKDARLKAAMCIKSGVSLLGANWVILPLLGERVFPLQLGSISHAQAATLGISLMLGTRGTGAILGAILGGNFAGPNTTRVRKVIPAAFLLGAAGYATIGLSASLPLAILGILLAHCGGSAAWTCSDTLLQQLTEDKFRGRVFSAEFALSMLVLSVVSFSSGQLADHGVGVRTLALWTGGLMLIPAALWLATERVRRE